jgi:DNA mismatch repair ATPase MutS
MANNKGKVSLKRKGTIKEYLDYHDKYQKIYGPKAVVLMDVGTFYEIYAVHNEELGLNDGPDVYLYGDQLNIQVTRKKKANPIVSYANALMVGVPTRAFLKYLNMLIELGYTVIQVDQLTEGKNPEREVKEIYSPGTILDPMKPALEYLRSM